MVNFSYADIQSQSSIFMGLPPKSKHKPEIPAIINELDKDVSFDTAHREPKFCCKKCGRKVETSLAMAQIDLGLKVNCEDCYDRYMK